MFTGIISSIAVILDIKDHNGIRTFEIEFDRDFCRDINIGASVAVDGVCLTVTELKSTSRVTFDVMLPSIKITTLGSCNAGARVNVERAAKDGAEIGGHPLSGHVDDKAVITEIEAIEGNYRVRFDLPQSLKPYVFSKGYIAINGASLTIADVNKSNNWFEVWLIPETRRQTTFEDKQVGEHVNIEIERGTQVVVDTIKDTLNEAIGPLLPDFERYLKTKNTDIDSIAGATVHHLAKK
ncbi:riboflavin synthase subunit alpha [Vibrio zhanjiangensis]|uniref:Riboflavin synthase n=1 Tax=Vibrio zhanjiangensis TaxID=1046128 RepID=A0ABQ6F2N9_9VIBR|nr:riboflavin synthase subunit alpha [Vibrio zhanjiangensis]GLT19249.1 riboflavin synthase subunit alpha [Vibrio zhanjiangensis]